MDQEVRQFDDTTEYIHALHHDLTSKDAINGQKDSRLELKMLGVTISSFEVTQPIARASHPSTLS